MVKSESNESNAPIICKMSSVESSWNLGDSFQILSHGTTVLLAMPFYCLHQMKDTFTPCVLHWVRSSTNATLCNNAVSLYSPSKRTSINAGSNPGGGESVTG